MNSLTNSVTSCHLLIKKRDIGQRMLINNAEQLTSVFTVSCYYECAYRVHCMKSTVTYTLLHMYMYNPVWLHRSSEMASASSVKFAGVQCFHACLVTCVI